MPEMARVIPTEEFEANCLALLDEVAATGEPLIITKSGKPMARVLPPEDEKDIRAFLKDSVIYVGDVEDTSDAWADWDPERGFRP